MADGPHCALFIFHITLYEYIWHNFWFELRVGFVVFCGLEAGTYNTKRQVTQHGCLPGLLGDGDKGFEIVYGEGKKYLYWADYSSQD